MKNTSPERSSCQRYSIKKDIDVGRKSLVLEALFNKNTGLQACNLLKRDSNKSVFL